MDNFTLLAQRNDRELAYGLIGKFWQLDYGQIRFQDEGFFRQFSQPDTARLLDAKREKCGV